MVQYLKTPAKSNGTSAVPDVDVPKIVRGVIDDIRSAGDKAVRSYSEKFDRWSPQSFRLSKTEIEDIVSKVPTHVLEDIRTVQHNVRTFAMAQRDSIKDFELEIRPGVHLGQKNIPISRVGA